MRPQAIVAVMILVASLTVVLAVAQLPSRQVAGAAEQFTAGELVQNGSFESGYAPWGEQPGTNFVVYANGQLSPSDTAFAGAHYAAMNTSASGGGIFQDMTGLTINVGDTICGSAEVSPADWRWWALPAIIVSIVF